LRRDIEKAFCPFENLNIPIRKKGYYRALRRNEPWAVKIESKKDSDPLGYLSAFTYRYIDMKTLVYSPNPFLSIIPKDESWTGCYTMIPFKEKK
jgi:hypothetical protein